MNLKDYYLDINFVFSLKDRDQRKSICNFYEIMLNHYNCGQLDIAENIKNTLSLGGYLKNKLETQRDDKIDKIVK